MGKEGPKYKILENDYGEKTVVYGDKIYPVKHAWYSYKEGALGTTYQYLNLDERIVTLTLLTNEKIKPAGYKNLKYKGTVFKYIAQYKMKNVSCRKRY
tara:strand:- start:1953 stop:2246 length:294 start_codon:yes stop_codon:yes gene_type:complete